MAQASPGGSQEIWPVAMLYAWLFLNAGLLQYVGLFNPLAGRLWWLLLILLGYGIFLGWGVFYVPARSMALHGASAGDLVAACLGRPFAWLFKYVMTPVWLAVWFAYNSVLAAKLIHGTLFERGAENPSPPNLWAALILLGLIVPAAAAPASKLARASVFTTKLSFVVIVGLALISRRGLPETMREFANHSIPVALPFDTQILLWAAPALLLAGWFTRDLRIGTSGLFWLTATGVVLPLVFAATAGVVTVAGTVGTGANAGLPYYFFSAYARSGPLSWVNLLWIVFTLLAAARFAAHAAVQLLPSRWRGYCAAVAISAAFIWVGNCLWRAGFYDLKAWQYCAIPFVPLAGVLCAAALVSRGQRIDLTTVGKRFSFLAWLAGCAVACLPRSLEYSAFASDPWIVREYCCAAWVVPGWLVSFGLTWVLLLPGRCRNRV